MTIGQTINVSKNKQYTCGFYYKTVTHGAQSFSFRATLADTEMTTSVSGPDAQGWSLVTASVYLNSKASNKFAAIPKFSTSKDDTLMEIYIDDVFCHVG